jgi:S-adenosylmethionine:tRNA ribosyltransferase-isomerase
LYSYVDQIYKNPYLLNFNNGTWGRKYSEICAMHPKDLHIKDYSYPLPEDRIAFHPLPERDLSKLLIYRNGHIKQDVYRNLPAHFSKPALLLFNNTRVIEARLFFQKSTGSVIEVFCLEPAEERTLPEAMLSRSSVRWNVLVGGAAKWKEPVLEKQIVEEGETILLTVRIVEKLTDCFVVEFQWDRDDLVFGEVLHRAGVIPLPPYINRNPEQADYERYQTVYARNEGSVAAPTAGLHFTESLLQDLEAAGIERDFVTLHVGAGTFRPVKALSMKDHEMHREWIQVKRSVLERIRKTIPAPIIPVGTTSFRTLESLYWMGLKAMLNPDASLQELEVQQWDVYELESQAVEPGVALDALLAWMDRLGYDELVAHTQLLVAPGYRVRLTQALVTNFHQPNSTLLLLVAALVGDAWRTIYQYALDHDFRFLSYGDGSLLWVDPS